MNIGVMDKLIHSTVRIETTLVGGGSSTGTGFYMNFLQSKETCIPVIVTNRHVVKNADIGTFHVTFAKDKDQPDSGRHQQFNIPEFERNCILHPDPDIDLAAFPIGPLINQAIDTGDKLFYIPLHTDLIPTNKERETFSAMEDIVMIGYPSGIWDAKNNLPVIRRGITATHSNVDWNGGPEFLTDIASFPGSSGSPVFLANLGGYRDNKGNTFMGQDRIRLLGVHYAGAMHTASGEIKIVTAPTSSVPVSITQIPNNIGVAINSSEILELEQEVSRRIPTNG